MTTEAERRALTRETLAEVTPPARLARVPGEVLWDKAGGLAAWLRAEGLPPVTGLELAAERVRRRRARTPHRAVARRRVAAAEAQAAAASEAPEATA